MAKRSRVKVKPAASESGAVGPRQPCPCGSGRRYKACHGSDSGAPVYVGRPFRDLPSECDVVAMRELVPAATAPLQLTEHPDRSVQLCTLLPMAAPALVRQDGAIWLGLQVQHGFGDPSRDIAAVLQRALEAEPGSVLGLTDPPGLGPRLQDLVTDAPLAVTVHDGFDFWVADVDDPDGQLAASLEQANSAAHPTTRLVSVEAAYWTNVGTKEHLRWVLPYDEDSATAALARLHAADADRLTPESRLLGAFRACGLLVPVWEVPAEATAGDFPDAVAAMAKALETAAADDSPLSADERRARAGLVNRQVTLR